MGGRRPGGLTTWRFARWSRPGPVPPFAVLLWALVLAAAAATSLALAPCATAYDWGPRALDFPDPGGDERAELALPLTDGRLLGVNDDFDDAGASYADVLGGLRRGGFNAARRTLSWWSVEPQPGELSGPALHAAGEFYKAALKKHMTPVFIVGFAPPWARDPEHQGCTTRGLCEYPPARAMDAEWSRFVAAAAEWFPKAVIEVWNEPNLAEFWESGPDPERYAELVAIAHEAVKQVNPDQRVMICACAGITPSAKAAGQMDLDEFLERAYGHERSIRGHHDGVSFHFYPQGYWPFAPFDFGAGSHLAELLTMVRRVTSANGEAGTPLWIDEVGYWNNDLGSGKHIVSESEEAEALVRLARRALSSDDIEAIFIHRAVDGRGGTSSGAVRDSTIGLLRRDPLFEPKPSFCAFERLTGRQPSPGCPAPAPPSTWFTAVPLPDGASPSVTFDWAAGELLSGPLHACSLDGSAFLYCSPGVSIAGLSDGAHHFAVRTSRLDGSLDWSTLKWSFNVAAEPVKEARVPRESRRGCTIKGTNADEILLGTPRRDVICGRGGDDLIRARGGHDVLRGGSGRDRLFGGRGRDKFHGGPGRDRRLG